MSYEELVRYQRTKHWAAIFDRDAALHYAFDGAKHPRGNAKNKGQFASKGSAGGRSEKPAGKKAAKEEAKPKKAPAAKKPAAKKPAAKKSGGGKPIEKSHEQRPFDFTGAANVGKESSILHQVVNAIDKAPDDPAQVQKQAEGVMAKVEAAIKEGKLGGTIPPAAKKVVDEHTESLMSKVKQYVQDMGKDIGFHPEMSKGQIAKRAVKIIGCLGLFGGSFALKGAAIGRLIDFDLGGAYLFYYAARKIEETASHLLDDDGSGENNKNNYARFGDVLRYEASADDEELSMDEIKELAKEYYGGILADLQKVLKPDAGGSYYDQIVAKRKASPA